MTETQISIENKNRTGLTAKGDQRQYVQHSYHDRSEDAIDVVTTSDENTLRLYREDSVGGPFPLKLQIVLKVTEKLGQQSIISWLPHGRSFMIHRPREFEEEVMGKFFKQTKLTSFRRQLNLYDFQRITHGRDAGSYYHELFLRGRPLLAKRMVRRKVKGTKIRASSSPDDEPNFYTMAFMTPITENPPQNFGSHRMNMGIANGHLGTDMMGVGGGENSFASNMQQHQQGTINEGGMPNVSHQFFNQSSLLQQQLAAQASFQNGQGMMNLYGGMHRPQAYPGTMDNLNYLSLLSRNNIASSLSMMNPYAGYPPQDAMHPAAGGDPRLSYLNNPHNMNQLPGSNAYPSNMNAMLLNQQTQGANAAQVQASQVHGQISKQNQDMNIPDANTAEEKSQIDATKDDEKTKAIEQLLLLQKEKGSSADTVKEQNGASREEGAKTQSKADSEGDVSKGKEQVLAL